MNTKEIVKDLAAARKISIAELERTLQIANGTISKWDKQNPSIIPLTKIANYFNVTTDYLIGREPTMTDKSNSKAQLLAAHIDDDVSDEEMAQILDYIELVKKANRN